MLFVHKLTWEPHQKLQISPKITSDPLKNIELHEGGREKQGQYFLSRPHALLSLG